MARQRKFDIGDSKKDIPYDKEGFVSWCMRFENLSESSANMYADDIRTAYITMFEEDDALFENIKAAFSAPLELVPPEKRGFVKEHNLLLDKWADQEDAYNVIVDYCEEINSIDEFGDIMIETFDGKEVVLPKEKWLRAFRTYAKYIRYKINLIYAQNFLPIGIIPPTKAGEFFDIPLRKQFAEYLKLSRGKNREGTPKRGNRREENIYKGQNGDYGYVSRLRKLYNYILLRHIPHFIIENIDHLLRNKVPLWKSKDYLYKYTCNVRSTYSKEYMSDKDLEQGKCAFDQYFHFMKEYSKNPDRYQPQTYTRKSISSKN